MTKGGQLWLGVIAMMLFVVLVLMVTQPAMFFGIFTDVKIPNPFDVQEKPLASRYAETDPKLREPYCGDGYLDIGEICDDGNLNDYDGCSANCDNDPIAAWEYLDSFAGVGIYDPNGKLSTNDIVAVIRIANLGGEKLRLDGLDFWFNYRLSENINIHHALGRPNSDGTDVALAKLFVNQLDNAGRNIKIAEDRTRDGEFDTNEIFHIEPYYDEWLERGEENIYYVVSDTTTLVDEWGNGEFFDYGIAQLSFEPKIVDHNGDLMTNHKKISSDNQRLIPITR